RGAHLLFAEAGLQGRQHRERRIFGNPFCPWPVGGFITVFVPGIGVLAALSPVLRPGMAVRLAVTGRTAPLLTFFAALRFEFRFEPGPAMGRISRFTRRHFSGRPFGSLMIPRRG